MFAPPGFIRRLPSAPEPASSVYRERPRQQWEPPSALDLGDGDPKVVYGICTIPPNHYLDVPFRKSDNTVKIFTEVSGATMARLVAPWDLRVHLLEGKGRFWGCWNGRESVIDLRDHDGPIHLIVVNDRNDGRDVTAYYRMG